MESQRLSKGRPPFRSVLLRSSSGQQLRKLRCCLSAPLRATTLHSARSLLRLIAWRSRAAAHVAFASLPARPLRRRSSTHRFLRRASLARSSPHRSQSAAELPQRKREATPITLVATSAIFKLFKGTSVNRSRLSSSSEASD